MHILLLYYSQTRRALANISVEETMLLMRAIYAFELLRLALYNRLGIQQHTRFFTFFLSVLFVVCIVNIIGKEENDQNNIWKFMMVHGQYSAMENNTFIKHRAHMRERRKIKCSTWRHRAHPFLRIFNVTFYTKWQREQNTHIIYMCSLESDKITDSFFSYKIYSKGYIYATLYIYYYYIHLVSWKFIQSGYWWESTKAKFSTAQQYGREFRIDYHQLYILFTYDICPRMLTQKKNRWLLNDPITVYFIWKHLHIK